jgi:uncharacterized repeat protein (TIGR03803 family)
MIKGVLALLCVGAALPALGRFQIQTVASFSASGTPPLAGPYSQPLETSDGWILGLSGGDSMGQFREATLFRVRRDGSTTEILHRFGSELGDGIVAASKLTPGSGGRVFGTCRSGGLNGRGTVFSVAEDGSDYRTLHHFGTAAQGDGGQPGWGVILGSDGRLYGSTEAGAIVNGVTYGGTLFRIDPDGSNYEFVWLFAPRDSGGISPVGIVEGPDGMLYGMSGLAGPRGSFGTVWKVGKDGQGFVVLTSFPTAGTDGRGPIAWPTVGGDGWLYGVTTGTSSTVASQGVIFRVNLNGGGFEVLRRMQVADGITFQDQVHLASDGRLYGCALFGGQFGNGTVFRMNTDGSGFEAISLSRSRTISSVPNAISIGRDGNIFGFTLVGGLPEVGEGTLFRVDVGPQPGVMITARLLPGERVQVEGTGSPGRTYQLETRSDLTAGWQSDGSVTADTSGAFSFERSNVDDRRFYRVVEVP